jgi:voltage-gated potassium channel
MGQAIASVIMICGYAIIAVPTGIVSVELANVEKLGVSQKKCPACGKSGHEVEALFCMQCGSEL